MYLKIEIPFIYYFILYIITKNCIMDKYIIDFNSFDHSFCEAKLWNSKHEYINTLSSIVMTLISYYAIYYNDHTYLNATLFFHSLAVNGITSALYHFYGSIGWGVADRISMIFVAHYATKIVIDVSYKIKNFSSFTRNILYCIADIYSIIITVICSLHYETLFNFMFGLFLAIVLIFPALEHNKIKAELTHTKHVYKYTWKGIMCIFLGCMYWIVTEGMCNGFDFPKYLFGHALWHIFLAYGAYLVVISSTFYLADKKFEAHTISGVLFPIIKKSKLLPH